MAGNQPHPRLKFAVPRSASLPGVEAPQRGPVFGARCAVAADHPLAALTGIDLLRSGANAVDAAIAVAAVLCVTKPHRTQLGGDAFALVWHRRTGAVECLNAGGRAPRRATPDAFAGGIAPRGARASTVPGIVDSWAALHERHGSRPLEELLAPAIELAERGFPVSRRLAGAMELLADGPLRVDDPEARRTFLAGGTRPYGEGALFRQPELAERLRSIARDGRDGFYAGRAGKAIAGGTAAAGGLIGEDDLAEPTAHWHEPLSVSYRGHTVYEQALPSQGIILLLALKTAERFPLPGWPLDGADAVHVMAEATRLAFEDARRLAADPLFEDVPVERLLSDEHAAARAAQIDLARAGRQPAAAGGDTTSFVVADEDVCVSYIQSVFWPWGSGFMPPGTGVLMNNRLTGFSLEPSHPNRLAPGKRCVHTLNTFLVVKDGELIVGGGTPGGDYQVQVNLQTIASVLDGRLDVQSAIDAPRWVRSGAGLAIEDRVPPSLVEGLRARGHGVELVAPWDATMCRSQVIASRPEGGWAAASDLRGEGAALAV